MISAGRRFFGTQRPEASSSAPSSSSGKSAATNAGFAPASRADRRRAASGTSTLTRFRRGWAGEAALRAAAPASPAGTAPARTRRMYSWLRRMCRSRSSS